jgi:hypothetical protein
MRPLFPANSSGKARRLRQGDLWDQSIHALEWPYREYLKNCHHDVHVIGRTVLVDGEERFDPVYHEPDPVLAAWSCAALYELSAACVLLAMIDEHEPLVNPRVAKQVNVWGHRVRGMMAHSSMSEPKP